MNALAMDAGQHGRRSESQSRRPKIETSNDSDSDSIWDTDNGSV